ncbi:hypothetical protein [Mediterraneibacter gnavus]|jgi:hypothetical protein|uniref:hypothetical protein n=1 Tax=Mediterraneibacter gnavus TaxID=33038 RepID=UPI0034BB0211
MEDPRIISALFIFLKMAYYNVLINNADNGYPREISYTQCDGQIKKYHVIVRDSDAN